MNKHWKTDRIILLAATVALLVPAAAAKADDATDLVDTAARQQDIREQTKTVAGQIDAIVGEFDANGLGGGDDVKTLRAVKGILGKLSDEQMQQVVTLLVQARDEKTSTVSTAKVADAYAGQKEIITQLRAMLVQYQRDQAMYNLSNKLNQLADRQNENLKGVVALAKQKLGTKPDGHDATDADRQDSLRTQKAEQNQIKEEVAQAAADLKSLAAQGGDDRLTAAAARSQDNKLAETAAAAANDLSNGNLLRAATGEKNARDSLRDLARLVAPPTDKATQLAQAAAKLDEQIRKQKEVVDDTAKHDHKVAALAEQKQARPGRSGRFDEKRFGRHRAGGGGSSEERPRRDAECAAVIDQQPDGPSRETRQGGVGGPSAGPRGGRPAVEPGDRRAGNAEGSGDPHDRTETAATGPGRPDDGQAD